jgi:hypothetical protein
VTQDNLLYFRHNKPFKSPPRNLKIDLPYGTILLSCLAPPRCLSSKGFHLSFGRLVPSTLLLNVAFSCNSAGRLCMSLKLNISSSLKSLKPACGPSSIRSGSAPIKVSPMTILLPKNTIARQRWWPKNV